MVHVDYFTDVLCIWAFIGEKRLAEVQANLAEEIEVNLLFLPNFSACHQKINKGWSSKGGFNGYAEHVREVAEKFEITLHPDTWFKVRPSTSLLAHSVIKSIANTAGPEKAAQYCSSVRNEFFKNAQDISSLIVLKAAAEKLNINWHAVMNDFNSGHGLAKLHEDFLLAKDYQITVSPAWVFNEGRQRLIGNVGYRVIEANLRELIEQKPMPQLWC